MTLRAIGVQLRQKQKSLSYGANEGGQTYAVGHIHQYNFALRFPILKLLCMILYDIIFEYKSDTNDIQIIPT